MKVLASNQATGTLYEFIQVRLHLLGENQEQIEAFGKELYHIIVQIVTSDRGFSLESVHCFPRMQADKMNIVKLYKWWLQFVIWQEQLITEFENTVLQNSEFTWE
jgi:hypothetical protein